MDVSRTPFPFGDNQQLALVAGERGIEQIRFEGTPADGVPRDDEFPVLKAAAEQLTAYFGGELKAFELPLTPEGTAFPEERVERPPDDPLRRDQQLHADGSLNRCAEGRARGRSRQRTESNSHRDPLPSCDRQQREAYGVRWRLASEAPTRLDLESSPDGHSSDRTATERSGAGST